MITLNPTKLLIEDVVSVETKTQAGIILPDAVAKKVVGKGKILNTGVGTADLPMVHKIGDTCLFHPKAGSTFTYEEKEYRLIDMSEVFMSGV